MPAGQRRRGAAAALRRREAAAPFRCRLGPGLEAVVREAGMGWERHELPSRSLPGADGAPFRPPNECLGARIIPEDPSKKR